MNAEREDSLLALQRMRTAIAQVQEHVKGLGLESFLSNKMVSDAALIQLHVLGEEMRRISPEILAKYAYPWHLVRAQRNVIAHDYFGIRLSSIWANIQQDLGPLDELLKRIIETEFP